ncbi:MAG TPA: arginine--tRNA ligase [Solirubrobacteraceae bacterium]|nr:arginine--tRNA ligase [Solirubrobacteraceae bacterium]
MAASPVEELRSAVQAAAAELGDGATTPTLERPKKAGFGDYSTNAAMLLSKALKAPPREIAERLGVVLQERLGDRVERIEVAGPGFLNVFLADAWYVAAAAHVLAADDWGGGTATQRERVNLEFVSANPTGPLTAASARHAAYGDTLARLLEFAGHEVSREYYFNDAGGQLLRLGQSIRARARGEALPEDGYQGSYVTELAAEIPDAAEREPRDLADAGGALMIERIQATLERYRVHFDTWFSERALHEGPIQKAFERVEQAGLSYRNEGALWLRTTEFGDDQDRVILKSNGDPTYYAADLAYVENKLERGFERLIIPLGSDHHGYVPRFKAAMGAAGGDPEKLEIPLLQFVHLVEGDERVSMSKRRGEFIMLDDLIDEIGVDATRFFMLQRSQDSTIDLDLDLARKESAENPVYYVQYAHARIASVLRKAGREPTMPTGDLELHPAERELIKKLLAFPTEADEAAERRAPHRIATYALELAQTFTAFYRDCKVVGVEPEQLESFRLGLCVATRRTIARALDLLGVSAPESM